MNTNHGFITGVPILDEAIPLGMKRGEIAAITGTDKVLISNFIQNIIDSNDRNQILIWNWEGFLGNIKAIKMLRDKLHVVVSNDRHVFVSASYAFDCYKVPMSCDDTEYLSFVNLTKNRYGKLAISTELMHPY